MSQPSVCIIGGGSSGLCALKYLSHAGLKHVRLFERAKNGIGGTWNMKNYEEGLPNSMYDSLRTNLPKQIMQFQDFEFKKEVPNFPSHQQVLNYLQEYVYHFNLEQYIEYGVCVQDVTLDPMFLKGKKDVKKWKVTYKVDNLLKEWNCDCIVVANGHYYKPYIPDFKGIGHWNVKGKIIHTTSYKSPNQGLILAKGRILVIGSGPSGMELVQDFSAGLGCTVFWFGRNLLPASDITYSNGGVIKRVFRGDIEFLEDGSTVRIHRHNGNFEDLKAIDQVVMATGYWYDFPFLDKSIVNVTNQNKVENLYEHFIHIDHRNDLFLLGLPFKVIPFPLVEYQCLWMTEIIKGKYKWEISKEEMRKESQMQGGPGRKYHDMHTSKWNYCDRLASKVNAKPTDPLVPKIYKEVSKARHDGLDFRQIEYETIHQLEKKRKQNKE